MVHIYIVQALHKLENGTRIFTHSPESYQGKVTYPDVQIMELEGKVQQETKYAFKSDGEKQIAYFLDSYDIRYQYEPGLLVNSTDGKQRIWYPDFYLPEFAVYIEYFGVVGNKDYDQGIRRKQKAYSEMGFDVISLYPWHFGTNWQGYVMDRLHQINHERQYRLKAKSYGEKAHRGVREFTRGPIQAYGRSPGGKYRS